MVRSPAIWKNKYFMALMAIFACALWGSAFPVLKISYAELGLKPNELSSRLLLAGSRFLLASGILFLVAKFILKQSLQVERRLWKQLVLLGIGQTGLQYFFFYNGLAFTGGLKSAVLDAASNFLAVIAAHFVYGDDRLNLGKIIGLVTGFSGIVLVNYESAVQGFTWHFSLRGEGFILLSGIFGVLALFQAKKLVQDIHPVVVNAYQLLFGSLPLVILGIPSFALNATRTTPVFWAVFVYSSVLSAAAFSIWYTLLAHNKAGEVTLYRFTIPVFGALFSVLALPEEQLTLPVFAALVLVALGLLTVNYLRRDS